MKITAIDSVVLTGQGGGGSFSVNVPNVTPGIGPASGEENLFPTTTQPASVTDAGAKQPATYPMTNSATTTVSQYSTIGPVPKG